MTPRAMLSSPFSFDGVDIFGLFPPRLQLFRHSLLDHLRILIPSLASFRFLSTFIFSSFLLLFAMLF